MSFTISFSVSEIKLLVPQYTGSDRGINTVSLWVSNEILCRPSQLHATENKQTW